MVSFHIFRFLPGSSFISNRSIRFKLTLGIILFGTLITGIVSLLLYATTRSQMRNDFRQRLQNIVSIGALSIDADSHKKLMHPHQEGSTEYLSIKTALKKIKTNGEDIHFVYTMRTGSTGKIVFVVDESDNPDEIAHLGEPYDDASPFLTRSFNSLNSPIVEEEFYTDRWGTWLTGYAPIFNDLGERVGVLGVDIKASSIESYEQHLLGLFFAIFIVTLALSSMLGSFLGKRFSDPIRKLKEHAEQIGSGDFDAIVPVLSNDELGVLAGTFNTMTTKLKDLIGTLQNEISHRKVAEKKFKSIFDNAMEGIFQSSLGGKLIIVNPAFADLTGYDSPADAIENIKSTPQQLYADTEQRKEVISRLESTGRISDFKVRLIRKDGSEIWAELTAKLVKDDGNEPFIEGLLKDISERLARETAEKEQQVAEAASVAKSEFLANMSHEIRTPMNAVMGLTHLALKTDLTTKQSDYLKKILNAAQSLLRIINDILDFSKIEAGKLDIEEVSFDIEEVMNSLADILSFKADEKGLEFLFHLDNQVPTALLGDPLRLEQILTNLVGNAIKFTEKGNIIVAVKKEKIIELESGNEVKLKISVKDTGIGLSEEQAGGLFRSFSQADDSITRKYGGTGLGLSISKSLVEMMNGEIWVESEPGQGSTFSFTAVFKEQVDQKQKIVNYPDDLKGMKVLVVDDNATAREIICEMLESFSFRAFQAPSGEEAINDLEKAQKADDPFKLVIMDWKMPGMDGLQTTESIHNHKELSQIPSILMLTAYSHDKIPQKADITGIHSFLLKPVNPSLLFDAIISVFHNTSEIQTRKAVQQKLHIEGLDQVRGARILLVEDYEINRQIATELLESEGFVVESANNGRIALEILTIQAGNPVSDLVLMDIQMPEMDGYTATRKIRELPTDISKIPIVAMTAHAMQSEKDKCFAAGMNDHIAKPIDPRHLIEVMVRWIKPGDRHPLQKLKTESPGVDQLSPNLKFKCIDVEAGLGRVVGNQKLYLDLLSQFAEKFRLAPDEIKHLLEQKKLEEAHTLAHAVKGMAGNLGAELVQEAAGNLETALKANQQKPFEELILVFEHALEEALTELDELKRNTSADTDAGNEEPVDPAQLTNILIELKPMITSDFGTALEKAEKLRNFIDPKDPKSLIKKFLLHLEAFEEKDALEILNQILD
jgi:two-component system, sensor histidine kinase and response regulator